MRTAFLTAAALALFTMPAMGLAQLATDAQYDDAVTQIEEGVAQADPGDPGDPGGREARSEAAGGPLPFTGMDALALVAVAVSLATAGVVLHRLSTARRRSY